MRIAGIEHNNNTGRKVIGMSAQFSKSQKAFIPKFRKEKKNFDFRKSLVKKALDERKFPCLYQ